MPASITSWRYNEYDIMVLLQKNTYLIYQPISINEKKKDEILQKSQNKKPHQKLHLGYHHIEPETAI